MIAHQLHPTVTATWLLRPFHWITKPPALASAWPRGWAGMGRLEQSGGSIAAEGVHRVRIAGPETLLPLLKPRNPTPHSTWIKLTTTQSPPFTMAWIAHPRATSIVGALPIHNASAATAETPTTPLTPPSTPARAPHPHRSAWVRVPRHPRTQHAPGVPAERSKPSPPAWDPISPSTSCVYVWGCQLGAQRGCGGAMGGTSVRGR
jgi:hypothetical protein